MNVPPSPVVDGPVFDKKYDNRTGDAGERIELKCDVDTNPPADLSWFREQEPDKVGFCRGIISLCNIFLWGLWSPN